LAVCIGFFKECIQVFLEKKTEGFQMSFNKFLIACAAVLPIFVSNAASAALITSAASLGAPNVTLTGFGPAGIYSTGYNEIIAGPNPLNTTYAGSSGLAVDYSGSWGLGSNGSVVPGTPSIGINQGGTLTFIFQNGPVDGVGILMNYAPGFGAVEVIALNSSDTAFQTYDITSLAPITSSAFEFEGIQDGSADIYGFELLSVANASPLVDSISYTTTASNPVPEPITLSLFGMGLAGAIAMRRRKKKVA
jgi:PEP-CTERM motif